MASGDFSKPTLNTSWPNGLLCNGASYPKDGPYSDLANKLINLDPNYQDPNNPDNFLVPDLRNKGLYGANDVTELGKMVGDTQITLQHLPIVESADGTPFSVNSKAIDVEPGGNGFSTTETEPLEYQRYRPIGLAVNVFIEWQ